MLAYVLALAVGMGSLVIYLAAFFFPEVHRKNDFIWSGVGLFYALVLWVCAGRITGSLLLGQVAGVALLGWSVGQTLSLRRQLTPRTQTELPSATEVKNTVGEKVANSSLFSRISQIGKRVGGSATTAKDRLQENLSGATQTPTSTSPGTTTGEASSSGSNDNSRVQIIDKRTPIPEQPAVEPTQQLTSDSQATTESTAETTLPATLQPIDKLSPIPEQPVVDTTQQLTSNSQATTESTAETTLAATPQADELVQAARESDAVADISVGEATSPSEEIIAAEDVEIAPVLTEEEAIALAVETTLAEGDLDVGSEPIRPHPPDPEIVEAAIRDAEEKHIEASPPEPETPENPSPS